MVGVLVQMIIYEIPVRVILNVVAHVKLMDIQINLFRKNYSCEKRLFDKLVLMCEDEILNATETLPGKKVAICEKYFIQIIHIALFTFFTFHWQL